MNVNFLFMKDRLLSVPRIFSHIISEGCICFEDRCEMMILVKKMKINKGKKNLNTNPSTLFSHIEPGRDLLTK